MKNIITLAAITLTLTACAGREARQYEIAKNGDQNLNCASVAREFYANETIIIETAGERLGQNVKNVALTAASVVFFPTLFFLDLKGSERSELSSLKARNHVLADLGQSKKCPKPHSRVGNFYDNYNNIVPPAEQK